MSNENMNSIENVVAKLATDAINIRIILDEYHSSQVKEFEALIWSASGITKDLLLPLRPPKYDVRKFELAFRITLSINREKGFEIRVVPLNIGYDLRYGSTSTSESTINLQVVSVPITEGRVT
jgi:hypothetical protein